MRRTAVVIENRGSVMLEATLGSLVFLLMLVGLVDMVRLAYTSSSLQYSVATAQRWAVLMANDPAPDPDPDTMTVMSAPSREQSIVNRVVATASKVGLTVQPASVKVCNLPWPPPSPTWSDADYQCATADAGSSDGMTSVYATATVQLLFGMSSVNVSARSVARNEPGLG